VCVICGNENKLSKQRIIPSEYIQWFPIHKKSHTPDNMVLLCNKCSCHDHNVRNEYINKLKEEYNVNTEDFIDVEKNTLKGLAISILKRNNKYCESLYAKIEKITGEKPTTEKLIEYTNYDVSREKDGTKSISEYIVKKVISENKLDTFIEKWREYFKENLFPQFLA
jgi:transketolase